MSVRLAAQESTLPGDTLKEKFEFTLRHGFDGIELSGQGGGVFASRAEELRQARDAGVVMCSAVTHTPTFLGSFAPEARQTAIADLKDLLSTIVEAGGLGDRQPERVRGVLHQAAALRPAAEPGGVPPTPRAGADRAR